MSNTPSTPTTPSVEQLIDLDAAASDVINFGDQPNPYLPKGHLVIAGIDLADLAPALGEGLELVRAFEVVRDTLANAPVVAGTEPQGGFIDQNAPVTVPASVLTALFATATQARPDALMGAAMGGAERMAESLRSNGFVGLTAEQAQEHAAELREKRMQELAKSFGLDIDEIKRQVA